VTASNARALDSDVIIIGDGVIGLSTALELARAGARAHIISVRRDGSASGAAAGLLAPSIGRLSPGVRQFFESSLAKYPAFVEHLRTFDRELSLVEGLIQVSAAAAESARGAVRLDVAALATEEPELVAPNGAVLHPKDSAIDNVRLMSALRLAVQHEPGLTVTRDDPATRLRFDPALVEVGTTKGLVFRAPHVVLAAGAWSGEIDGLPRPLPVVPLKGQMLALGARCLRHAIAGDDVYLVPRREEVVAGATVEHAGFDTTVDDVAIENLRQAAIRLCPVLGHAPVVRRWAGIRPATPDLLPVLGTDPDVPALIYACGHSKNGILLAPETAVAVSNLAQGHSAGMDISMFSMARFGRSDRGDGLTV
jgi:glycine/D-amino acid oxidase-like deaminating enzyme